VPTHLTEAPCSLLALKAEICSLIPIPPLLPSSPATEQPPAYRRPTMAAETSSAIKVSHVNDYGLTVLYEPENQKEPSNE
jgi:hypothetical protein